jgi:Fur family ferric uptake transcriptional regulator
MVDVIFTSTGTFGNTRYIMGSSAENLTHEPGPERSPAIGEAEPGTTRLERLCREQGVFLNTKRRAILKVLTDASDHPTIDDIHLRVKAIVPSVSLATIYRAVNELAKSGLLLRHDFGDGKGHYEEAQSTRHEHLIDVRSGAAREFHDPALDDLLRDAAARLGYRLVHYRLELFGEPAGNPDTER